MITLLYVFLTILGIICLLPFSKKIPVWLIGISGFSLGLIIWVLGSVVALCLNLAYTWITMFILVAPLLVIAILVNISKGTFRFSRNESLVILVCIGSIALLGYITTTRNLLYATADSFSIIFQAQSLVRSGLVPWSISQFTEWGVVIPVFQMTGSLFGGDYISGYQTLLAWNLVAFISAVIFHDFRKHFSLLKSAVITGAIILVFFSKIVTNHVFYIHNNIPAAVFLLISMYSFREYLKSSDQEWIVPGSIFLAGFGFSRIEGPVYVILVLVLVMAIKQPPLKQILLMVLPFSILSIAWHLILLFTSSQNQLLSDSYIIIILAANIGLLVFGLISQKLDHLLSALPEIILAGLFFAVILVVLIEPEHMIISITHYWQNLLDILSWGWTWYVILAFCPFVLGKQRKKPENKLFITVLGGYILFIFLFVVGRLPYRLGDTDSANRLMLQILPVIILLISSNAETLKLWFSAPSAAND